VVDQCQPGIIDNAGQRVCQDKRGIFLGNDLQDISYRSRPKTDLEQYLPDMEKIAEFWVERAQKKSDAQGHDAQL